MKQPLKKFKEEIDDQEEFLFLLRKINRLLKNNNKRLKTVFNTFNETHTIITIGVDKTIIDKSYCYSLN